MKYMTLILATMVWSSVSTANPEVTFSLGEECPQGSLHARYNRTNGFLYVDVNDDINLYTNYGWAQTMCVYKVEFSKPGYTYEIEKILFHGQTANLADGLSVETALTLGNNETHNTENKMIAGNRWGYFGHTSPEVPLTQPCGKSTFSARHIFHAHTSDDANPVSMRAWSVAYKMKLKRCRPVLRPIRD